MRWIKKVFHKIYDQYLLLIVGVTLWGNPAFAASTGIGGWLASRTKDQGQGLVDAIYTGLQVGGIGAMAWGAWMIIQHNIDKKKGQTPNTSWTLVFALLIGGAICTGFSSWTKMADETAWGSSGGNNTKITIQ